MRYVLLGEPAITQYFMIDAESGEVSLRKSLMDDPNNRESYGVSTCTKKIMIPFISTLSESKAHVSLFVCFTG